MSRILVLNGSMRRGGNTELLVQSFAEGAQKKQQRGNCFGGGLQSESVHRLQLVF